MIVDSHLHVWDLRRCDYPWLGPALAPIDRTLTLADIETELDAHAVGGVVLVQSADDPADTAHLLAVADTHPRVLGVVAWAPLDDPTALEAMLPDYLDDPRVVGVRALIHEHPVEWLDRPAIERSLALLADAGLPLDVPTTGSAGLRPLPGWLERHPGLRLVIDHLGKPPIGGARAKRTDWFSLLGAVAEHPLTVAKVSGLYRAHGALADWTVDEVRPFVEDALALFGPSRLLAGGDWPIAVLAGGYDRTMTALTTLLAPLDPTERDEVLGLAALRAYGVDAGRIAAARAAHPHPTRKETP